MPERIVLSSHDEILAALPLARPRGFAPSTSKWNKIEHRLFSHITANWRGRPLTSHEVVVKTIEWTRTRTGLRVEAALDTGDYPIGITISKQRLGALPLQRHTTNGAWNDTLHPQPATATGAMPVGEQGGSAERRREVLARLADPRLNGMSTPELDQLAAILAPAQAARTQQRYSQQRGGRARRETGNLRGTPLFDDAARLLLTLIYQRQVCSMNVLGELLEVTATCIASLVKETSEILEDHDHHPGATSVCFGTAADLIAFLDQDIRPTRTGIIQTLSDPVLTGMSRDELRKLTERLATRQAAQAERLTHQRRGRLRQPGTRRGSFRRRSATMSGSYSPSSTCANCAPSTFSPTLWAMSAAPRSVASSARRGHYWSNTHAFRPPLSATAPPPNSSPQRPHPAAPTPTHRRLDLLA